MQLQNTLPREVRSEASVCEEWVPLAGARVLELGCGRADSTRELAQRHPDAQFVAQEVDTVQHGLNLAATVPPNVTFALGGAQEIPVADGSYDAVLMFKSLHHVPVELLDRALSEIHRVLAPGGIAFFAEPVFEGEYNEVIRIFHDEERVRLLAFAALERAVGRGQFELVTEQFFDRRTTFDSFAHFEKVVIGVTHTQHRLTPSQFEEVRERFSRHLTPTGAEFRQPMRADVLRKRG
jgi:ubiquinone/menaquinone biosynthesis C-methylase UbiE